jgi:hypothetical protein
MEGAARAAKARHESETALAWQTASFSAAAQAGKLKKLSTYLAPRQAKAQTPAEMLEVFRTFQSRGAPMNIRQIN